MQAQNSSRRSLLRKANVNENKTVAVKIAATENLTAKYVLDAF